MLQFTIEPISSVKEQVGFLLILLVLLTITILMIIPSSHGLPLESCESSSGYTYLPNGLLMEWGYMSGNTESKTWNVTFSPSFTTLYALVGGLVRGTPSTTYEHMNFHSNFSRTGFTFNTYDKYQCFWIAIGKA